MGWQDDRQRTIANTLAMIRRLADDAPADLRPASLPQRSVQERQQDIDAKLLIFRNRQRFEQIEREVHYWQALQRIEAVTGQWT